jgi:hypothetical protein
MSSASLILMLMGDCRMKRSGTAGDADPYRFDGRGRQPSPIDEASPVILKVDQALNDHDWSAFSAYFGNGTYLPPSI